MRSYRVAAGLSQEQLAEQVGLSTRGISDLERGARRTPRLETVRLLADGLGLEEADRAALLAARGSSADAPPPAPKLTRSVLLVPVTPLIGRQRQVREVSDLLHREDVRLVTLTGPGGVGKTRLALAVAHALTGHFTDGTVFVDLSPIRDPVLVLPTIAAAIGVQDTGGQELAQMLVTALQDRHLMLILDNFEQVIDAAPDIVTLLAACPALKILATSRVVLRITAEHIIPIRPLELPDRSAQASLSDLSHIEAVAMFVARARAADPSFVLTDANATTVTALVRRLDGLPLAIELAGARIRTLPPETLLTRLEQRLQLLTGGSRDAPARQRTMRDAIAWSYDLLTVEEQVLFRRLAVFVGGFTPEAVEAVVMGAGDGLQAAFDGIASLLDKSLARRETGPGAEPRYRMLETVREFALGQLVASNEEADVRDAHSAYFLEVAETEQTGSADPGPRSTAWMDRLETELDNLRAALAWERESGNVERSLRFGAALWQFWWVRGYITEGGAWLEETLARGGDAPVVVRAAAVHAAGNLARYRGDFERAVAWHREDLALRRELGDTRGTALALLCLGLEAFEQGDYDAAVPLLEESEPLFRMTRDRWGLAHHHAILGQIACLKGDYRRAMVLCGESITLFRELGDVADGAKATALLGWIVECQGEVDRSPALYEEALGTFRSVGDKANAAVTIAALGMLACRQGDVDQATALLEEALVLSREVDSIRGIAAALSGLGHVSRSRGDHRRSIQLFLECLALSHRTNDKAAVVDCLEGLASALLGLGDAGRAARFGGASAESRAALGISLPPADRADHERMVASARAALGGAAFVAARAGGQRMSLEQAVTEALALEPLAIKSEDWAPKNATKHSLRLSPRELDVLRLLAQGCSDREIAESLFVSRRTVTTHVTGIFTKLNVSSRSAAAVYAVRHELA